ncbi:unnamed protein product [Peronospora belbahrii]|uniref:Integrase catalytic domain-containing protein n=1 Tax=Peronospora belbahrii TaxID=622444 RepID=A0AAU9L213_9STRA|nr:unnamed protein product [Peronospora belbahrii]CAH0521007.1 unnamed protein product [Peronospora belbahrii]
MDHLAAVPDSINGEGTSQSFVDRVFRQHGLPVAIVLDRDPVLRSDGQTERVNRVIGDMLRSVCAETPNQLSAILPLVEVALNNAVHALTGFTPLYGNGLVSSRVP